MEDDEIRADHIKAVEVIASGLDTPATLKRRLEKDMNISGDALDAYVMELQEEGYIEITGGTATPGEDDIQDVSYELTEEGEELAEEYDLI